MSRREPWLSICIPTFRRERFLEAALRAWGSEIASYSGLVELLIGDNDASESVRALVAGMGQPDAVRYVGHAENRLFNGNVESLVRDHARGRMVWICGDDDFVHRGAVAKVLRVIGENPDLDYFYVNSRVLPLEYCTPEEMGRAEDSPHAVLENPDARDRRMARAAEIVLLSPTGFTGVYGAVWSRTEAARAFAGGSDLVAFETLKGTFPHACHIAQYFLDRPCYYFGEPLLTVSHAVSYDRYGDLFSVHWLPRFYDLLQARGIPRSHLDPVRRRLFLYRPDKKIRNLLRQRGTPYARGFSLPRFIRDHWRFREFYGMLFRVLGGWKLARFLKREAQP